jgi:hypothetical protein
MSEVPDLKLFRKAVDTIPVLRDRDFVKVCYLLAARVSEVLLYASPYDMEHFKSRAYGQTINYHIEEFEKQKVLVIKMGVLKRAVKGLKADDTTFYKSVALPCDPQYEPWCLDLLKRIAKHKTLAFTVSRHTAWRLVRKNLSPLDPKIHTHSLRHYRISHLLNEYGFDAEDLVAYSGWSFKTMMGMKGMGAGQLDIYAHLAWKKYFPKLLKVVS